MTLLMSLVVFKSTRLSEHLFSKLPMLLGVSYLVIWHFHVDFSWEVMLFLVLLALVIIGFAALGYLTNDWFDRNADRSVGKSNFWNATSIERGILMVLAVLVSAITPWLLLPTDCILMGFLALEAVLFMVYSIPPIRLKERGVLGPVTDALYAMVTPLVVVLHVTTLYASSLSMDAELPPWRMSIVLWFLVAGVRKVMLHQVVDHASDRMSATRTLAVTKGLEWTEGFMGGILWSAELVLLAFFMATLSMQFMALAVGLTMFFGWRVLLAPLFEGMPAVRDNRIHWHQKILDPFMEVDVPMLSLLVLCYRDFSFLWLLIAHAVLFYPVNNQWVGAGKDYVVKPLYYKGVVGLVYWIYIRLGYGLLVPLFIATKRLSLSGFHLLRKGVIWAYFNIVLKGAVFTWHLGYFVARQQWHPESPFQRKEG